MPISKALRILRREVSAGKKRQKRNEYYRVLLRVRAFAHAHGLPFRGAMLAILREGCKTLRVRLPRKITDYGEVLE